MEDGRIGRIENGGKLKLKQIWIHIKHHKLSNDEIDVSVHIYSINRFNSIDTN